MSSHTLPDLILSAAAARPEAPALIDGATGAAVSYRTLVARVEAVAAGLQARGFGPGDTLAICAPNMPQWAGVALGAMAAGGCVTGVLPAAPAEELAAQLADARASVLVTVPERLPVAREAAAAAGTRALFVLGSAAGAAPVTELLGSGRAPVEPAADPGAVAFLPYSSGTTGLPKGVMLTHSNLVAAVGQVNSGLRLGPGDRLLAVVPFCHVMGFVVKLAVGLSAGASVVTMPRFDLEPFLGLIERHRVSFVGVPPPVFAALASSPAVDRHDLSSLELIVSGGAPLAPELQQAVEARFPYAAVGQGYGLTETSVIITMPDRRRGSAPGSVGRLAPGTELRVVDPTSGADLPRGATGELWVRGPQVMAGYLGRPAETAAVIDAGGWLRTGDIGSVDEQGDVAIVDRLKELIKVSAHQVAPAELEALLVSHPAVADAAVIPREDERRGQMPIAVVVARDEVDGDELIAWVAERVAPHKRIAVVRFADAIPRTASGKILRRALVEADRQPA